MRTPYSTTAPALTSLPALRALLRDVCLANDTELRDLTANREVIAVFNDPEIPAADWRALDLWLASLSHADRETLADGDADEAAEIAGRSPLSQRPNNGEHGVRVGSLISALLAPIF